MQWNWDDKIKAYVNTFTDSVDTILLGRKMTDGFVRHWESFLDKPDSEEYLFAKKMTHYKKYVFSKTLKESNWKNTKICNGDLSKEVDLIKKEAGKNIVVYGGASFVKSLTDSDLIDEFNIYVNPVCIGNGLRIFDKKTCFKLNSSIRFDCGIVLLNYSLRK